MKRSLLSISAGLIATMAFAQSGPVTSVNVVGFNKLHMDRGGMYLVSMAFEDLGTNALHAADVFADQLPSSTKITYYSNGGYNSSDKRAAFANTTYPFGWGAGGGSIVFHGYMSFWVQVPNNNGVGQQSFDVVLKGQVPDDTQMSNVVVPGLNQLGYPYTAEVAFSNTALYAKSITGDTLTLWNPAITNYATPFKKASFGAFRGWGATAAGTILHQGVGFWYKSVSNANSLVTEDIPYSL